MGAKTNVSYNCVDRHAATHRKNKVAILWEGNKDAAIRLEDLWTKLQSIEQFPLFCAYPCSHFKMDAASSIESVCAAHSRVIPGYV